MRYLKRKLNRCRVDRCWRPVDVGEIRIDQEGSVKVYEIREFCSLHIHGAWPKLLTMGKEFYGTGSK